MKKILLLSLLTIMGTLAVSQMVLAANATLSVSPVSANATVGNTVNASVKIDPAGNKVCVIKGTLSINNLSCRSITVTSGLYAIVTPTCANPSFILGIPKCTTTAQNILSVSVKGAKVGQANLSLTGIKVIGVGTDVAFDSQGGVYNITAVATQEITTPTITPTGEVVPEEVITPLTEESVTTPENNIPANVGVAGLGGAGVGWTNILWVLLVLAIIGGVVYLIYRLKGKKK